MARTTLTTYFQNFSFHVLDLTAPIELLGTGSTSGQFVAISPQIGFQSVDIPDRSIETEEIDVGASPHSHHVPVSAEHGTATLSRGVLIGDIEFYQWMRRTEYGRGQFRRTLGIVQVHGMPTTLGQGQEIAQRALNVIARGAASLAMAQAGVIEGEGRASAAGAAAAGAAQAGGGRAAAAAIEETSSRAWVLEDCIPVSYNPASDGLGADDEDVTIAELEVQPEKVREANFPPGAGLSGGLT